MTKSLNIPIPERYEFKNIEYSPKLEDVCLPISLVAKYLSNVYTRRCCNLVNIVFSSLTCGSKTTKALCLQISQSIPFDLLFLLKYVENDIQLIVVFHL